MNVVLLNGQTWLICGGRSFADEAMFGSAMADIVGLKGCPSRVVHGDAAGADRMAVAWGRRMAIEIRACPADWRSFGASAGRRVSWRQWDRRHGQAFTPRKDRRNRGTTEMNAALEALTTYMEPPTVPDDARQCGAFPCKLQAGGACHACGESLCEDHAIECSTCGEKHCRRCLTSVDDLMVCHADFPEYINDLASVIAHEREDAERRKKVRAS